MRLPFLVAALLALLATQAAALPRSAAAKAEFKRLQPCPATSRPRGPCPGWQIDHVIPLKCGGADAPINMQWLTVADHKDKTRRESRLCLKGAAHEYQREDPATDARQTGPRAGQ